MVKPPRQHPATRLHFLDALRGFAAIWVIFFHLIHVPNPKLEAPSWILFWAGSGGLGVPLCFLVSAFSLCYTAPGHEHQPKPLLSFYLHRFFRIAPLFYAVLVFTILRDKIQWGHTPDPGEIAASLFFVFNLIPGLQEGIVWASWTIGVEMLFYLFFPVFYKTFGSLGKSMLLLAGTIILAALAKEYLVYLVPNRKVYFGWSILKHLPVFAAGMVVFYLWRDWLSHHRILSLGFTLAAASVALFVAYATHSLELFDRYYWGSMILSLLFLGCSQMPPHWFSGRIPSFLGKTSYSLYLLHPPVLVFLDAPYHAIYRLEAPLSVKYLACAALTLLVLIPAAGLSFRYIERPGIRLGNRLSESRHIGACLSRSPG